MPPYEYKDYLHSYGHLPMEIILHIFGFLENADRQAAGATCKRWRDAQIDAQFHGKALVRFAKVCLSDRFPPGRNLLNSPRPFRHFYLEGISLGNAEEVIDKIGKTCVDITFDAADISDKQFYGFMSKLPHLRSLKITLCSHLFMSGTFLNNNDDRIAVNMAFSTLKHLSLSRNQYLSDAIFTRLTALIQAIETLDLSGCNISYHSAVNRRFYPNGTSVIPSEAILTFKFIARVLSVHSPHLRELNFSDTMISSPALLSLLELKGGELHLLRLQLACCRQLKTMGVKLFLQTQPQLVVLNLSQTTCVNDEFIECMVQSNPLLEDVNFSGCPHISNSGAVLLATLKHLRRLNISSCLCITNEGIINGIARTRNETLWELQIAYLKVFEDCIKAITTNLPQLRILNVGHCVDGVSDEAVQSIIKNLRWLRELSLEECSRITDYALTGINLTNIDLVTPCSSLPTATLADLENLNTSLNSIKISLLCKAEEHTARDAFRKRAMFEAYEMSLKPDAKLDGFSVQDLRGLKVLNLKGCTKITDVSLKYGLKFLELRRLSLSNCQQISTVGLETLASKCRAIEELDLSECYNVIDSTMACMTKRLKRLRMLHIDGCIQLTDETVDSILKYCKYLQILSVHRCRGMYAELEDRLGELPTLRTLYMDKSPCIDYPDPIRYRSSLDY